MNIKHLSAALLFALPLNMAIADNELKSLIPLGENQRAEQQLMVNCSNGRQPVIVKAQDTRKWCAGVECGKRRLDVAKKACEMSPQRLRLARNADTSAERARAL